MTLTLLEEEIIADIEERKSMMVTVKTMPYRYSFSDSDNQLFTNYSMAIVYAIWEGFVQTSFQTYIRELNKLNLGIDEICDEILVSNVENNFRQFHEYPSKVPQKVRFLSNLRVFFNTEPMYINPIVNTQSNVGLNVINGILRKFNLHEISEYPKPNYSLKNELDNFLLKCRNDVAHGNNAIIIKPEDIQRAIELVELLMDEVFDRIKKGFINDKKHLKLS